MLRLGCGPRKGTLPSPAQPRPGETPQSKTLGQGTASFCEGGSGTATRGSDFKGKWRDCVFLHDDPVDKALSEPRRGGAATAGMGRTVGDRPWKGGASCRCVLRAQGLSLQAPSGHGLFQANVVRHYKVWLTGPSTLCPCAQGLALWCKSRPPSPPLPHELSPKEKLSEFSGMRGCIHKRFNCGSTRA